MPLPSLPEDAVWQAADNPEIIEQVASLYRRLDAVVAADATMCHKCGRCCHFGEFGHRLFVTTVEVAYFLAGVGRHGLRGPQTDCCPYQQATRCTVRPWRPAACRIFSCESKQPDANDRPLDELRALHTSNCVPYAYVDWISCLNDLRTRRGV